jgi:hypothetical protein
MVNERIRELKKQAEKFVLDIPAALEPAEFDAMFAEKLSELVIQECIDNLNWHGHDEAASQLQWLRTNRFGIKQ